MAEEAGINKDKQETTPEEGTESEEGGSTVTEGEQSPDEGDLQTEVATLKSDKVGLVGQVKELRKKLQTSELDKAVGDSKEKEVESEDPNEKLVLETLRKERAKEREANKVNAREKFLETHTEYHEDNDPTGLRNDALVKALNKIKTDESFSVEQILADYEDAVKLIAVPVQESESDMSEHASTSTVSTTVKTTTTRLTPEQDVLRKGKGWTVEKYLEMKEKYPRVIK